MYIDFVSNIIEVLFFCSVIIFIDLSFKRKYTQHVLGICFTLITVFIMNNSIVITEGRFFDFRHITMTMAGFIGGPVTAVIAASISSLYRYNVGGSGMLGGISSIIFFGCFGSILGRFKRGSQDKNKVWFWLIIGIVIEVLHLLIIAFIHPGKTDFTVVRIVAAPLLIMTPVATIVIFNFYYWACEFFSKSLMLNTIINNSHINLMIFDSNGLILRSKNLETKFQPYPFIENPNLLLEPDKTWLNTTKQQQRDIATEDGRRLVADLSSFQMPNGEYTCVAILHDETDLKKEQNMLKSALERFSRAFQLGPHMMTILRKSDYTFVDANRRYLEAKGLAREGVIGKRPTEVGAPEGVFKQFLDALEAQGSVQNFEAPMVMKDGSVGTVILSSEQIQIDDQECILFAYTDITEMKRMQMERTQQLTKNLKLEEELSRSNQLIADIIDNMSDGFYVLDNDGNFTYLNKNVEELVRKTRDELIGQSAFAVTPQGDVFKLFQQATKTGVPATLETLGNIQQDTWYQVTAYPSQYGLSVFYSDITERKLSREKLMKAQEDKISILESMTDSFFAINRNWQFTYVNRAAEIVFGRSRDELLGMKITELFKVNDTALRHYNEVMSEKKSVTFELMSKALGGKWLEISAYPTETGMTCYFSDITSRKISEKEFARLERLNLVGQLAAGIGHEIRNPMTTVRGYLQLLGTKPVYAAQKATFELMISELDRANAIITEFLSLAQTKPTDHKPQNLNGLLNNLYPLLEADAFTQNNQITFAPGEIPDLKLNGKEISQLVLNLTRNGLEAMPHGGCLRVNSYVEDSQVVLAIEDEGCGIPPENLSKVGTPFFTTKDTGTGLGLATCYKIVESHNAKIRIDSSSKGTTFFISFPIHDE